MDVYSTTLDIFQKLALDIPVERLEIERAHKTLTKSRETGMPRDVVVKLVSYSSKECLLEGAREKR